jgi:hypothetical protein
VALEVGEGVDAALVERSVGRLLRTAHGVWLADTLCSVLGDPGAGEAPTSISVAFVNEIQGTSGEDLAVFRPTTPQARRYEIFIRPPLETRNTDIVSFGESSANPDCSIVFLYRETESWMAEALFHELLHVWFVNAYAGHERRFPTGHGRVDYCELEPEFSDLLDAFARELAALEGVQPVRMLPFGSR